MVLPYSDVNPTLRRPLVTWALIAINVVVYFGVNGQLDDGCELGRFLYRWAAIPSELLSFDELSPTAVQIELRGCDTSPLDKSVIVSAFTAMFLHGNVAHLFWNMLFLWVFGNNVEDRLGRVKYLVFYLGGGLIATYAFALLHARTNVPLLGASGAIAAVLGAYVVMFPQAQVNAVVPFPLYLFTGLVPGARIRAWLVFFALVAIPAWVALGAWFVTQLFSADQPAAETGVAFEAHIAGFVAGLVLALLLNRVRRGGTHGEGWPYAGTPPTFGGQPPGFGFPPPPGPPPPYALPPQAPPPPYGLPPPGPPRT